MDADFHPAVVGLEVYVIVNASSVGVDFIVCDVDNACIEDVSTDCSFVGAGFVFVENGDSTVFSCNHYYMLFYRDVDIVVVVFHDLNYVINCVRVENTSFMPFI